MSRSPLDIFPDRRVLLPPAFCGDIERYAIIAAYGGRVRIDTLARFNKREKSTHRCTIADTRGPLRLTVPIEKPSQSLSQTRREDIVVSGHGDWPRLMVTALESAYGRTPFFEFYADRLCPLIMGAVGLRLVDLDEALDREICRILGINLDSAPPEAEAEHPAFTPAPPLPYWQIRADRLGFIPGLSILDLIFNLGPESPLHLRRMLYERTSITQ